MSNATTPGEWQQIVDSLSSLSSMARTVAKRGCVIHKDLVDIRWFPRNLLSAAEWETLRKVWYQTTRGDLTAAKKHYSELADTCDSLLVELKARPIETESEGASRGKRKRRSKRRQKTGLTSNEQTAWASYEHHHSYTDVGRELGISRQAATKLVKSAQRKVQAISGGRSVASRAQLPVDRRGQLNVSGEE